MLLLLISGSFAEEDIGRQGIAVPSVVENATASRGLEVAVANLQDYCNGMLIFSSMSFCLTISDRGTGVLLQSD